ncbi:MAG: MFS transporter [Verrucomicrobiota bacterium]
MKDETGARRRELGLLLLLACVQFTHIMDFMIMMPLGPQLMRDLSLTPQQFGNLISVFAITAGAIGLLTAPFADRFDRRRMLLVCYAGFALGTLACGLCETGGQLLIARAICGAFGGVSGATIMAIVADLVPPARRARGMGIIMTAFSAAAALGVPLGLKLAQWFRWETPFLAIAGVAALVWVLLCTVLPPMRGHLTLASGERRNSSKEFIGLLASGNAWRGVLLIVALIFGHFSVIPYLSPFLVQNAKMAEENLFLIYLTGGLVTIFTGPLVGKLADRYGRYRVFVILVLIACVVIRILSTLGPQPLWVILVLAALFFMFASARFIPAQAAVSQAVPSERRGAYMSLIACSRDLAAGVVAAIGGRIVIEDAASGNMLRFDWLGLLAIGVSLISLVVFRSVKQTQDG